MKQLVWKEKQPADKVPDDELNSENPGAQNNWPITNKKP